MLSTAGCSSFPGKSCVAHRASRRLEVPDMHLLCTAVMGAHLWNCLISVHTVSGVCLASVKIPLVIFFFFLMWNQNIFQEKALRKSEGKKKCSEDIGNMVCKASEIHPTDSRTSVLLPAGDKWHQLCYRNNRRRGSRSRMFPALLQLPLTGWWVEPGASSSQGQRQSFGSPQGSFPASHEAVQREKMPLPFCVWNSDVWQRGRSGRQFRLPPAPRCCQTRSPPAAGPAQPQALGTFCCRRCWALPYIAPSNPLPMLQLKKSHNYSAF